MRFSCRFDLHEMHWCRTHGHRLTALSSGALTASASASIFTRGDPNGSKLHLSACTSNLFYNWMHFARGSIDVTNHSSPPASLKSLKPLPQFIPIPLAPANRLNPELFTTKINGITYRVLFRITQRAQEFPIRYGTFTIKVEWRGIWEWFQRHLTNANLI